MGAAALFGVWSLAGEDRRRSQRVVIRIPIMLEMSENGQTVRIPACTSSVNSHGAIVVSPRALGADAKVALVNERTREKIDCRVTRAPRECSGGSLIPVEFSSASPNFWHITFPVEGWKPVEN